MDINALKGRIAEALVESIFRQAGYSVSRLGRESQVQRLVKTGSDRVRAGLSRPEAGGRQRNGARPPSAPHRRGEVAKLAEFLRRDAAELFEEAKRAWPNLYFVLVTDEPNEGRSCFQAVALREFEPAAGAPLTTDLHRLPTLDILLPHRRRARGHGSRAVRGPRIAASSGAASGGKR